MKTRSIALLAVAALVLFVSACGGSEDAGGDSATEASADSTTTDGGDTTTTSAAPSDPEPSDGGDDSSSAPADPPAVGEMGSFTVNGTEYAVTFLNRCVPFSGPDSGVIDLQPIAQGQGAQMNLYGDGGDFDEVSVQGSTIQQTFGSIAFSTMEATESNIAGDRWTGSATLEDAAGGDAAPVEVTWDVMVPAEAQEC